MESVAVKYMLWLNQYIQMPGNRQLQFIVISRTNSKGIVRIYIYVTESFINTSARHLFGFMFSVQSMKAFSSKSIVDGGKAIRTVKRVKT